MFFTNIILDYLINEKIVIAWIKIIDINLFKTLKYTYPTLEKRPSKIPINQFELDKICIKHFIFEIII